MVPYYICIAGSIGSGKSTLALNLSNLLGWSYLPTHLRSINYLKDLFKNPVKWAFETQSSFLIEKSMQVSNDFKYGKNIILDRSIYEDIDIFAKYFFDKGFIDQRSWKTYLEIAKYIISQLPVPDAIIYTYCSIENIKLRNGSRLKKLNFNHDDNYLVEIYKHYESWERGFNKTPVYKVNSDKFNLKDIDVVKKIIADLSYVFSNSNAPVQLNLYNKDIEFKKYTLQVLEEVVKVKERKNINHFDIKKTKNPSKPYVYIAAPFTNISVFENDNLYHDKVMPLFSNERPHGKIIKGKYRNTLLKISNIINNKYGLTTLLPHKDVNEWGEKILAPSRVFDICTSHVMNCDFFIGILGESHGSHYEFGIAIGRNIPSAIIQCDEINTSFIMSDIKINNDKLRIFKCELIFDIPKIINSEKFMNFINQYFEIKK